MPFKSQAQRRLFYAKARRGEMAPSMVKEWEEATPKGAKLPEKVKTAEPPPPEGVSAKEWDKQLGYVRDRVREGGKPKESQWEWAEAGPTPPEPKPQIKFKFQKFSDFDEPELQDPMRLMPYLRSIHKMGQAMFQGIPVEIERERGTVRTGINRFGVSWQKRTHHDYGSIPGSVGMDGEEVDVYLGPKKDAPQAFVVHQKSPDGRWYDEDKVMLGFGSEAQARRAFLQNAGDIGKTILGPITPMPVGQLRRKVEAGDRLISSGAIKALRQELGKKAGVRGAMPEDLERFKIKDIDPTHDVRIDVTPEGRFRGIASAKDDELTGLYVVPRYRRQGVATGLLQSFEKQPTHLERLVQAQPARAFYERHGFEDVGSGPGGVVRMEKKGYTLQGHTDVQGIRVAIENRKGSVRKGTDSDGHEWRTKMIHPYGYLVGTRGADDEPVDAYVGPDKDDAPDAYVVHQHKDDGTGYDEDKVMLGFKSKKEAKEGYLAHYDDPKFLGPVSRVSMDRLKELVESKKRLVKISAAPTILVPMGPHGAYAEVDPARVVGRIKQRARAGSGLGTGVGGLVGAGMGALRGRRNLRSALVHGALGAGLGSLIGGTAGWSMGKGRGKAEALKMVEPAGPEAKEYMRAYLAKYGQVEPGPATPQAVSQIAPTPRQPAQEALKKREQWRLARKAGPGIGGLLGAGVGAAIGARRGALVKGLLAGLGSGATLGWMPDMYSSAREAIQRYKRVVPT